MYKYINGIYKNEEMKIYIYQSEFIENVDELMNN